MSSKTVNTAFTIPEDLLNELDKFVGKKRLSTDRSRSSWLVYAVRQLLNKPIDEDDYDNIEMITERNVKIVGSFMEHCEENGLKIPDSFFESYFNA